MNCLSCERSLDLTDERRRYCNSACRTRAYRARQKIRQQVATDLVMRQTRAIIEGDFAALALVQRDAEVFFA